MNLNNQGKSLSKITFTFLFIFYLTAISAQSTPFITTWKPSNPGISNSSSITILTDPNYIYSFDVDWNNDGVYDDLNVTTDITHDYSNDPGTPLFINTIAIRGVFPRIYFNNGAGDIQKLMSIEQWGDIEWQDMNSAFKNSPNMVYNATDAPDLSNVSDMSNMFYQAAAFNGNLNNWNTSNVTNMSGMFFGTNVFNGDISNWNTGNVTDMSDMFRFASAFNGDISNWNTGNVLNTSRMFQDNGVFNGSLNNWNTVSVTNMSDMFRNADAFNQDLNSWNTVNVNNMENMFRDADVFNGNISNWNTVNVTDMSGMFYNADAFNNDLNSWNTLNVVDMSSMFVGAALFNSELNNWNTANVTDMSYMFSSAESFNRDLNNWNTASVIDMSSMFAAATVFNGNISSWNTGNVNNMGGMFINAFDFNGNINTWNTGNVSIMYGMFSGASSFNQDLDNWNTYNVEDMADMFRDATAFNGNIGTWDVSYVSFMEYMFSNASSFDQSLGNWNIQGAGYMNGMLDNCGMSSTNYDNTLIGWAAQFYPQIYVELGAAGLNYCQGESARNTLINTYNWTITGDVLDCPASCSPPSNINVEVTTPTTALFSWELVPDATFYQIKYRLKGTNNWLTLGTENTQRNIPNLSAKKYYQYKLRAQCADGSWSDFSDIGLFYTSTCDVPTGITVSFSDDTRMRVRWDNNPDEIKGKIRYRAVGITDWVTQNSQDGNNFLWVNNLPAGATIQYKVRSNCDGNDWSAYSPLYTHILPNSNARLSQEGANSTIKLYPNPAKEILNIEFEILYAEKVNITISDNLGRNIHVFDNTYREGRQKESIDVSSIPDGYYFVTIQSEYKVETQKFIKAN